MNRVEADVLRAAETSPHVTLPQIRLERHRAAKKREVCCYATESTKSADYHFVLWPLTTQILTAAGMVFGGLYVWEQWEDLFSRRSCCLAISTKHYF